MKVSKTMCRIIGSWDFTKKIDKQKFSTMVDSLRHGGPDDSGVYYEDTLAFGHRRLSIIDLSNLAHQPMISKEKNYILIFNGELYNYQQIRKELMALGHIFFSNSDTEVVLNSYIQWGEKCVDKFDGMWAFAIRDINKNIIFLCRDRLGVKPLYWYFDENIFMFGSELKSFKKHPSFKKSINQDALYFYFKYGYIGDDKTIFSHCNKLEAGTFLTINNNKEIEQTTYYTPDKDYHQNSQLPHIDILPKTKELLTQSILSRTVSDVGFGVFLSGGNDSSLVTAILKEHNYDFDTFTIGFDETQFDEAKAAKKISEHLGVKNHTLVCTASDLKALIKDIIKVYDEPFADSSAIPTMLLCKYTAQHVKVALSADGGDEQFYGYKRYQLTKSRYSIYNKKRSPYIYKFLNSFNDKAILSTINLAKKNMSMEKYLRIKQSMKNPNIENIYKTDISIFKDQELASLMGRGIIEEKIFIDSISHEENMQLYDLKKYLKDDILVKTDRASMRFGLEVREPLLGKELVSFTASLPLEYKYKNGNNKAIMKELLESYLPKEIIHSTKKGFSIPLEKWFLQDHVLKQMLVDELSSESLKSDGYINYEYVQSLLHEFLNNNSIVIYKLWLILIYKLWKDEWQ